MLRQIDGWRGSWLTLPDDATTEGKQRKQLREWALASYKNAVDPQSPDYLCWGIGGQNLVDAAISPRASSVLTIHSGSHWTR